MLRMTEQPSMFDHLEKMTVDELVKHINDEDKTVPFAIEKVLPQISKMISAIESQLRNGGRMFYMGCGTGGRLAVMDIVELPNTYGIEKGVINCILAGRVENIMQVLEEKEDDRQEAWQQLTEYKVSPKDFVIGISASGTTPFVLEGMKKCKENHIPCGSFVNNPNSPISEYSDYPIEILTGPEFVTGSTRMKAGTSQKLLCDMISTTVLIRLGRVEGNRMVNVRLINDKVVDRSVRMFMERNPKMTDYKQIEAAIRKTGNVKKAEAYFKEQGLLK